MSSKLITLIIVVGQAIWALGQALVILLLTRWGGLELVGSFVFGLAVFSPTCLALSFNLRALIAIDDQESIDIQAAMKLRLASILAALLVTAFAMVVLSGGFSLLSVAAFFLVSTRAADQMADIAAGYYQRSGQHWRIGLSAAGRGVASIASLSIIVWLGGQPLMAAVVSSIVTILVHIVIDLRPILSITSSNTNTSIKSMLGGFGSSFFSSPLPLLESLYTNSLRYAVMAFFSASTLGLVSIAQTIYVPLQLVLSAVAMSFVTKARSLVLLRDQKTLLELTVKGALFAFFIGMFFVVGAVLIPPRWLEVVFGTDGTSIKSMLVVISLSALPFPIYSYLNHVMTALELFREQIISVLLSAAVFGLFLLVLQYLGIEMSVKTIAMGFALGGWARLFFNAICVIRNGLKGR